MTALSEMGYTAQLIVRLLEIAGPMTAEQIKQWVAESKVVDVTIDDILGQMVDRGFLTTGPSGLYRRVAKAEDCPCGGSNWDHMRLVNATRREAQARSQARNLQDILDAQFDPDEMSMRRRIVMQRREIKAAWASSRMYQRKWRKALGYD